MKKIYGTKNAYNFIKENMGDIITYGTFQSYISLEYIKTHRIPELGNIRAFDAEYLLKWAERRRKTKQEANAELTNSR